MKYRLDADHYIDDKLIPAGTVIGDETEIPYRFVSDVPDGKGGISKAGDPKPPSRSMIPVDGEAKQLFEKEFGQTAPERDPTKAIPLQGTGDKTKVPGVAASRTGTDEQYKKPLIGSEGTDLFHGNNKAKMESPASEGGAKPKEPEDSKKSTTELKKG